MDKLQKINEHQTKKIVVIVGGGISAYKTADLVSKLVQQGHQIKVIMSRSATEFITPMTFTALCGHTAVTFDQEMKHIDLARFAELIILAPATANRISKLCHGIADDLIGTFCLATNAPRYFAPAMNVAMWNNAIVQENVSKLKQLGWRQIGPEQGSMACGDYGLGKMSEAQDIAQNINQNNGLLKGKTVVITAGPTYQPLDEVRYIANKSSGKMGYALAQTASVLGANVTLISGPTSISLPQGVKTINVTSAEEMYSSTISAMNSLSKGKFGKGSSGADYFIGAAAVADYTPMAVQQGKISKKKTGSTLNITLKSTKDIITEVAKKYPNTFIVGFCASTERLEYNAKQKLINKKLNMIVANIVGENADANCGFDGDNNHVTIFWKEGNKPYPVQTKQVLAYNILRLMKDLNV